MAVNEERMITEKSNIKTADIDKKTTIDILKIMNDEDKQVAYAVEKELPNIAKAVDKIVETFRSGGRLIYIGAGTSGRLGVLDASECPPTFSTSKGQVIGIIAGGKQALTDAIEGAEDYESSGMNDLKKVEVSNKDVIVGITASGNTPYVLGAIEYANNIGAETVGISCNQNSRISKLANISITPVVGPEVVTGSTRLKAGTAQKMVLNMLTTVSMIGMGKVYKNLMVDLQPTNKKLRERSKKIVMEATGISEEEAKQYLKLSNYKPKIAIVMIKTGCSCEEAIECLEKCNGSIYKAIEYKVLK